MTDAITHLEELIAHQPDGSPLTPKLHDVVAEIMRLQAQADAAQANSDRFQEALAASADELTTLRAEHAKLRELAGAVSTNEPDLAGIKQAKGSA